MGTVFEKEVQLPSANEKYYYKFVVDDNWTTDHEAAKEDDGHHNVNNVLLPSQVKKTAAPMPESSTEPSSGSTSKELDTAAFAAGAGALAAGGAGAAMLSGVTPGSTTAEKAGAVPKEAPAENATGGATTQGGEAESHSSPPGAFPEETPAEEKPSFGVAPIPASAGVGNPVSVPAGETLPEQKSFNPNTTDSTATTSKEGYEKDASAAWPAAGALAGAGALGAAGSGIYEHEKNKESEKAFGVDPIPASSGIGNPTSVPAGEKLPEQKSFNPNTIESTATTSKEGYERDASAPIAGLKGQDDKPSTTSAFSVPEKSKNMIPESSLPMGDGTKEIDSNTGPFIQSAAPQSSSFYAAATAPIEARKEATVVDDEAPSATMTGPPSMPEMVKESQEEADQSPEAAAYPEELKEKSAVEKELMSKVKSTDATGEPAPKAGDAITGTVPPLAAVDTSVPETVQESITKSHQSPEAASSPEAIKEKSAMESELLKTHKPTEAAGEPAPTDTATTASTAPKPTMSGTGAIPEATLGENKKAGTFEPVTPATEVVHPMPDAPHSKTTTPATEVPTKDVSSKSPATPMTATSTDGGKTKAATPAAATSSPASSAGNTTSKKDKRRSFFGKLKDKFKEL